MGVGEGRGVVWKQDFVKMSQKPRGAVCRLTGVVNISRGVTLPLTVTLTANRKVSVELRLIPSVRLIVYLDHFLSQNSSHNSTNRGHLREAETEEKQ